MAFTQTDIDALDRAIASGELTVETAGRRISYRSIAELKTARTLIASDIASAATNRTAKRRFRFNFVTSRE